MVRKNQGENLRMNDLKNPKFLVIIPQQPASIYQKR